MRDFVKRLAVALLTMASGLELWAEVAVAPIFSDNMVLQRDAEIPLRGTATDEQQVTVLLNGREYASEVEDGRWKVLLPPKPAGGSHTIEIRGSNRVTLKNITFGDVWLCAGQSNMDSPIEVYKQKFPDLYAGLPVPHRQQARMGKVIFI